MRDWLLSVTAGRGPLPLGGTFLNNIFMTYKGHIRGRRFNVTTCIAMREKVFFRTESKVNQLLHRYISAVSGLTLGCVDVTTNSSIRKYGECQPLSVSPPETDFRESLSMLSFYFRPF